MEIINEEVNSSETINNNEDSISTKKDSDCEYVNAINFEEIRIRSNRFYDFFKRCFDILFSLIGLIILSPLMLFISLLIKFTSKGPIIYKDKRIGRNGKEFYLFKFRSMYQDAEIGITKYLSKEQYDLWVLERKLDHDPRITKVGRFLRKTSIDELPQLLNILGGSLSIIGPRAITLNEWKHNFTFNEMQALLSIKPGLSGYWAAYARSNATFETGERQKLELNYLSKRNLVFDFYLIILTIFSVIKRKGAK